MTSFMVRPGQAPAMSQAGLSIATTKAHCAMLTAIQKGIVQRELHLTPLPDALVQLFQHWRREHKWRWATVARNMGTAIGAFAHLPLYTDAACAMNLMFAPVWRTALRTAERECNQERPRTPQAASPEQIDRAVSSAPNPSTKAMLILAWQTTMRLGDVAQLRRSDVVLSPAPSNASSRGLTMSVTFHRSKTARHRGPFTVHGFLPQQWVPTMQAFLDPQSAEEPLFPVTPETGSHIVAATRCLKTLDPQLEARSLRRGSLQTLATKGASHEQLLHFSGHKSIASLLRYLNWGAIVGREESELAALGSLLAPTA